MYTGGENFNHMEVANAARDIAQSRGLVGGLTFEQFCGAIITSVSGERFAIARSSQERSLVTGLVSTRYTLDAYTASLEEFYPAKETR